MLTILLFVTILFTLATSESESCGAPLLGSAINDLLLEKHDGILTALDQKFATQNEKIVQVESQLADALQKLKELESLEYTTIRLDRSPENDIFAAVEHVSEPERFDRLKRWLIAGGAKFNQVQFEYYSEDYRGLMASAPIQNESTIVMIPWTHIMFPERILKTPLGRAMGHKNYTASHARHLTAAFILSERFKPNSFWAPYISVLPRNFPTTPLYWNDTQLAWLEGTSILQTRTERLSKIFDDYDETRRLIPEFSVFTFDDYLWARTAIATRVFGLELDGRESEGMVPFADMLNHAKPAEAAWDFNDHEKVFEIKALQDIPQGTVLHESYGGKCQSQYLLNYGFTVIGNDDYNSVQLFLNVSANDRYFAEKTETLGFNYSCWITQVHDDSDSELCLSWARVASWDGPGWMYFDPNRVGPISFRNERSAIALIAEEAQRHLSRYPTTYEQDLEILANEKPDVDFNYHNAVNYRAGEKRILNFYIKLNKTINQLHDHLVKVVGPDFDSARTHVESHVDEFLETHVDKSENYTLAYFDYFLGSFFSIRGIHED